MSFKAYCRWQKKSEFDDGSVEVNQFIKEREACKQFTSLTYKNISSSVIYV